MKDFPVLAHIGAMRGAGPAANSRPARNASKYIKNCAFQWSLAMPIYGMRRKVDCLLRPPSL